MVVKNKGLYLGIIKKQTIINNKSKFNIMTTLQMIDVAPYKVVNQKIQTLELDEIFAEKTGYYLKLLFTAPFTISDTIAAEKAALKEMVKQGLI